MSFRNIPPIIFVDILYAKSFQNIIDSIWNNTCAEIFRKCIHGITTVFDVAWVCNRRRTFALWAVMSPNTPSTENYLNRLYNIKPTLVHVLLIFYTLYWINSYFLYKYITILYMIPYMITYQILSYKQIFTHKKYK